MILIHLLKETDKGRWVGYVPAFGKSEKGRIKSWNDTTVFVVYKCDGQWWRFQYFTGAATNPADLVFIQNDHPNEYPADDSQIVTEVGKVPVVTAEDFMRYVERIKALNPRGEVVSDADLNRRVDLISRTMPQDASVDFWAGFVTGLMVGAGAYARQVEEAGHPKLAGEVVDSSNGISIAVYIAYIKQMARVDDLFDRVGEAEIED